MPIALALGLGIGHGHRPSGGGSSGSVNVGVYGQGLTSSVGSPTVTADIFEGPSSATVLGLGLIASVGSPTISASLTISNQTILFGADTVASAGGAKPVDSDGNYVDATGVSGVSGGSTGWSVSSGTIIRSSPPIDAVLSVTTALGTVDVTITVEAAARDVRNEAQLLAAMTALATVGTPSKIYLRADPAASFATFNNTWFSSRTNTAVITVQGRSSANWVQVTTSKTAVSAGIASPGNFTFRYIKFFASFDRTTQNSNSLGLELSGTTRGPIIFDYCEFSATPWSLIGPGPQYRGVLAAAPLNFTLNHNLTLTDCVVSNSRRGINVSFVANSAGTFGVYRTVITDISVDFLIASTPPAACTIQDVDMHSPLADLYRVSFLNASKLEKAGNLTGVVDGTQALLRMQVEFDDAIASEGIVWTTGGFTVRRLSTGEVRVIANDTSAAAAVTLTTASPVGSYRRVQILVSLNTAGTSYLSVGVEGIAGAWSWQEVNTTAASQTLDLTGTTTIHSVGAGTVYMTTVQYWTGISPNISQQAVKDLFCYPTSGGTPDTAAGMIADRSALFAAYPSPLVDFYNVVTAWRAGTNGGSGGTFSTYTPTIDRDHMDSVQFAPNRIQKNIRLQRCTLYAGRFDALRDSARWDDHGCQGIPFAEDTGNNPVAITIPGGTAGVVTLTAHGMSNDDPVSLMHGSGVGDALPTGLAVGVIYYVRNKTADTFELAATAGGASIITSGTQQGTPRICTPYVNCVAENILVACTSGYGCRWSNGVECVQRNITAVVQPNWTADYSSDTPSVGMYLHNTGGAGTTNEIYDVVARGTVDQVGTNTFTNNIAARYSGGVVSYTDCFAGDGGGGFVTSSFANFKSVWKMKPSGSLDLAIPVGALNSSGAWITPRTPLLDPAPIILTLVPSDEAGGIAITISPVATFDQSVQFGTGTINLCTSADVLVESFDVTTEVGTGNGQVSISGADLTINPTASLANSTDYYIKIDATAIENLDGVAFVGITDKTTWNFQSVASSAVSLAYLGSDTETATTGTFNHTGGGINSGHAGKVAVAVIGTRSSTNGYAPNAVTIGGVAATLVTGTTQGTEVDGSVSMWRATLGGSPTDTCVVTYPANVTSSAMGMFILTNANATPTDSFEIKALSPLTTTTNSTDPITTPTGGVMILGDYTGTVAGVTFTGVAALNAQSDVALSAGFLSIASRSDGVAHTNETITATGSSFTRMMVGATWGT